MTGITTQSELGVRQIAERIHGRLQRYLEAQYHIRNSGLIEERRRVLSEPGGISQRPFVEVTPSYAVVPNFSKLRIPSLVRELLQELVDWNPGIGVYLPYKHQADALEHFFSHNEDGDDLIIATGTGSGKTETFLYSVLGMLAIEGSTRPISFAMPGVRTLMLYPMNALVSDQTGRLRRLMGDERFAELFRERWKRHPTFGMYTSRTPYPGVRINNKTRKTEGLLKIAEYYENLESSSDEGRRQLVNELKSRGRWPAKDMAAFFNRSATQFNRKGGIQNYHFERRFLTDQADRELLTRHEMHERTPDLLITNYSMLEYMLLRPIERPIFNQTRDWLASDHRNQLLLILDEAHMYRGVGGAEVGLLIRRLISRLGITRERLRCILTSASLGSNADAEAAGRDFARGLTGQRENRKFAVVRGTREARQGAKGGTLTEAQALAKLDPAVLAVARVLPAEADLALERVSLSLNWPKPPSIEQDELKARQHVCRCLTGFGPLELLIEWCSGNATEFMVIAKELFPDVEQDLAERATDGLLALGTFARRTEQSRGEQPLLPTRVHLMYRGLPPLFVCVNQKCTHRRDETRTTGIAGRLYTEPRTHCGCGARVYELLTHRDCGAAYLRVFGSGLNAEFFWHERGGVLTEFGRPLHEIHLLLEEPHPDKRGEVNPVVLDILTGRVLPNADSDKAGTRLCYRPADPPNGDPSLSTFGVCPACTRRTQTGNTLKIMDLATKGEQPFANLVREQFVTQLPTKRVSEVHPNEGRKSLLFSDGRQKAARLARDLPREVERDSFREVLVLAVNALGNLSVPMEPVLDERLYAAFVSICTQHHLHFFDGTDQRALLEECARFRRDYEADLEFAIDAEWRPTPTTRYRQALIRQIGDPYYSLVAACAATVSLRRVKLRLLQQRVGSIISPNVLKDLADIWLKEMLSRNAFDPSLSLDARQDEFPYFSQIRASDGLNRFFNDIRVRAGLDGDSVSAIRDTLFDVVTRDSVTGDDSGRLVAPDAVFIKLAIDEIWLQCAACGHLQIKPCMGGCENCGHPALEQRSPDHPYMVARKGFFREPLRAVLAGDRPVHITAEEHTAQLSQRDAGVVYATTEEFELRFQDVPLGEDKPPVDVLSCTTTMEVGIDIGSLTAVGLRTVPPQRENYQQRAGRSGRRGTSVSSVLTFAQGGAHDAFYFEHPATMISGEPREPRIKSDNQRLAQRHIHSHLLQTFFHSQIDKFPAEEQARLASERPGIMSAFGDVNDFFCEDSSFSHAEFDAWLKGSVLLPNSSVIDKIAAWLPPQLAPGPESLRARKRFVRKIASALGQTLEEMGAEFKAATAAIAASKANRTEPSNDEISGSLLDTLFDRGLLPSYAFPTDLAAFIIQEWADGRVRVSERPQMAKTQALSEYAPGRLLVVNKQTYRVGGVFVEGSLTSCPATDLFAGELRRYVGCQRCSFVRLESGNAKKKTVEGTPCPVCLQPLFVQELIDPPAFTPEIGRPLSEGDRDQDITYASSAQLPELVDREEFLWIDGPGVNLEHAVGDDVMLIVVNKGMESTGFSVCESCGAAWLDGEEPAGAHLRPFLLPRFILNRENAPVRCPGNVRRGLFLGHEFRTDLLLVRVHFRDPFDFSPEQPWLYDALITLSEALCLGASLHLDIDPVELSAGFRLLPGLGTQEDGVAEVYLYDTASGGAGYAADAGIELDSVLKRTIEVLEHCPARCERSCTKCLRHYGNRFLHSRLDRRIAITLLRYARFGELPEIKPVGSQTDTLGPLRRFLELEGWSTTSDPALGHPLAATDADGRRVIVGTYPALLDRETAENSHPVTATGQEVLVLLPDYVVERDLPSAYQIVAGLRNAPSLGRTRPSVAKPPADGRVVELSVREIQRPEAEHGKVRLRVAIECPPGAVAVRVPSAKLVSLGLPAGLWVVLSPSEDIEPSYGDQRVVLLRRKGTFQATGERWTVARVKYLNDARARLQVSYGGATGRQFRPERLDAADVMTIGRVVCAGEEVD